MVKCEYCGKNFKNLKLHQSRGKCGAAKAKKHRKEREEADQAKQEEKHPIGSKAWAASLVVDDRNPKEEPHPDCIYNDPYADDPHRTPCLWCDHLRLKEKVEMILEHMCKMCKKRMEIP